MSMLQDLIRSRLRGGAALPELANPAAVGDVAQGKEYIDENGEKQTGTLDVGVNVLNHCKMIRFDGLYPSDTPNVYLPEVTSAEKLFYNNMKYTEVTVTFNRETPKVTNLSGLVLHYAYGSRLRKLTINGKLSAVTTYVGLLYRNYYCTGIYGDPLDFSSVTNADGSNYWGAAQIQHEAQDFYVRYVPNSLHVNHMLAAFPSFSDDSLVSIANGLRAGANTITLHADMKARAAALVGTVRNNGTYDEFTIDANGTTTLTQFITTVKGWTIA